MIQPSHRRHDTVCRCGHPRRSHVDCFQKCDECECQVYDGPHEPIPPPAYLHGGWSDGWSDAL